MQGHEDTDSSCHVESDSFQFLGNDRCRWRDASSGDFPSDFTSLLM